MPIVLTVLAARHYLIPSSKFESMAYSSFSEIEGRVSEETLVIGAGRSATVIVIDSTRLNHSSVHRGPFGYKHRLVGLAILGGRSDL